MVVNEFSFQSMIKKGESVTIIIYKNANVSFIGAFIEFVLRDAIAFAQK